MHVSYIMIIVVYVLEKAKLGKRKTYIFTSIVLFFFMFVTGFTPSVVRACIMGIIALFAKVLYRKSDLITSISFSLILILLKNPYAIYDIGLQLSYLGTIRNYLLF